MNYELEEVVYDPGTVPLSEATVWPDDMCDNEARFFVKYIERHGNARIGAVPCPEGEHWMMGDPEPVPIETRFRCPVCRAEP